MWDSRTASVPPKQPSVSGKGPGPQIPTPRLPEEVTRLLVPPSSPKKFQSQSQRSRAGCERSRALQEYSTLQSGQKIGQERTAPSGPLGGPAALRRGRGGGAPQLPPGWLTPHPSSYPEPRGLLESKRL